MHQYNINLTLKIFWIKVYNFLIIENKMKKIREETKRDLS